MHCTRQPLARPCVDASMPRKRKRHDCAWSKCEYSVWTVQTRKQTLGAPLSCYVLLTWLHQNPKPASEESSNRSHANGDKSSMVGNDPPRIPFPRLVILAGAEKHSMFTSVCHFRVSSTKTQKLTWLRQAPNVFESYGSMVCEKSRGFFGIPDNNGCVVLRKTHDTSKILEAADSPQARFISG